MSENRVLRLATIFILYAGQGIPIGLFDFAIPGWMAANGASAKEIAFVVMMVGIPWSFKFLNGFLMDRYTFLPMGRRRAWIVGAQVVMVTSLLVFALIDPGPRDFLILGIVGLVVNSAVTFQDVAVDGLTVDILPESERGIGGAMMAGAQGLGIAASAALTGAMIYIYGASAAYMACALLVAFVTLSIIYVRERTGERRMPWSEGAAQRVNLAEKVGGWVPLLRKTFGAVFELRSLLFAPLLFARGFSYGCLVVIAPLIATKYAGWTEQDYGSANGTGFLIGGLAALVIGPLLAMKLSAERIIALTFAGFAAVNFAMLSSADGWADAQTVFAFIIGWLIMLHLTFVGLGAIGMRLCDPQVAATQFSIYMAMLNAGISVAGLLISSIGALSDPRNVLIMLICVQLAAVAISLVMRYPARKAAQPDAALAAPA